MIRGPLFAALLLTALATAAAAQSGGTQGPVRVNALSCTGYNPCAVPPPSALGPLTASCTPYDPCAVVTPPIGGPASGDTVARAPIASSDQPNNGQPSIPSARQQPGGRYSDGGRRGSGMRRNPAPL